MAILLSVNSFIGGKYDIPEAEIAQKATVVQDAINIFEKEAIYLLLGVTEGDRFITWVQASFIPANADYTAIKDAFAQDEPGCGIIKSNGMIEFLKAYVFYQYIKNGMVNGHAGVFNTKAETADKASPAGAMRFAESYFNGELDTALAIQWYCEQNPTAFPDYNGQHVVVKYSSLL
jgi:hypothetical protein